MVIVVIVASLYGKEIAKLLFPSFSTYPLKVVEEFLQLGVVLLFLALSRSFSKVGNVTKLSRQSLVLMLPIILLSFIPLFNGVVIEHAYKVIYFAIFCLCIGFTEELACRGLMYSEFSQWGKRSAIVLSSVAFGVLHITNLIKGGDLEQTLIQIVFATGFGLSMAVVRFRSELLLPQILVHALWDFNSKLSGKEDNVLVDLLVNVSIVIVILWGIYLTVRVCKDKNMSLNKSSEV